MGSRWRRKPSTSKLQLKILFLVASIEILLARIIPSDDSSVRFSMPPGVGISSNPDKTLDELFDRYVERYATRPGSSKRDNEDVWKVFREPLEKRELGSILSPKRIVGSNYDYEFQHAWKNEIWHVVEPISFDYGSVTK